MPSLWKLHFCSNSPTITIKSPIWAILPSYKPDKLGLYERSTTRRIHSFFFCKNESFILNNILISTTAEYVYRGTCQPRSRTIQHDTKINVNIAPRLGFCWDLPPDQNKEEKQLLCYPTVCAFRGDARHLPRPTGLMQQSEKSAVSSEQTNTRHYK